VGRHKGKKEENKPEEPASSQHRRRPNPVGQRVPVLAAGGNWGAQGLAHFQFIACQKMPIDDALGLFYGGFGVVAGPGNTDFACGNFGAKSRG
jgi:hypothetical protein